MPSGLPAATRIGTARLAVTDLSRSAAYYEDLLGLSVLDRGPRKVALGVIGTERPLLQLESSSSHRRPSGPRLGLYHFALLVPDRAALGRFLTHASNRRLHVSSADHAVSEALYLWDPDGLGIEVYRDRPRSEWQMRGDELFMTTEPLNLRSLLGEADGPWLGMPSGTVIGHMHLHVGDIPQAETFYHRALGFDRTVWSYPGALFMAAGGYHHHLGTNTWAGAAPSRGDDEAGLLDWEIVVPTPADVEAVADSCAHVGVRAVTTDEGLTLADPWGTHVSVRAQ